MSKISKALVPDPVDKPKNLEDDWEVKNHLETLMNAERIKADPAKMKRVHALAGRHHKALKAIKSIQDVKDRYDQKFGRGATPPDEIDD